MQNDTDETPQAAFWNRVAQRYAAMPMRNPLAWEETLTRTRAHLNSDARVLELGCGTGSTAVRLAPYVMEYIATDDAGEMIAIAVERGQDVSNLRTIRARPGDGSVPKGPYDAVVAFNLLHLIPDLPAVLAEIYTLLKPAGLLISKTPCLGGRYRILWPPVRLLQAFGKAPPLKFLKPDQMEQTVAAAGFTILERDDLPRKPPSRFLVARRDERES